MPSDPPTLGVLAPSPQIDTDYCDHITCPHCGYEDQDTCDYPESLRRDDDSTEVECGRCEREFHVVLYVTYAYSSRPLTPSASSPGRSR